MSTRNMTQEGIKKTEDLKRLGINYELLHVTETGLKKNILDATLPIIQLLKKEQIHDYDAQQFGPEHKVILPCIVYSNGTREETKSSLYRASGRGDTRFWPGRFNTLASTDQTFAMFIENGNIILLNLSDSFPLDESNFITTKQADSNGLIGVVGDGKDVQIELDESSEIDTPSRFEVSSYGWDSDVEGLVKRLKRGDIKLPGFQRGFVWSLTEQSRFIESLILGLPVPNIFLAQDRDSKTLNIVDGQQRLKTLQRFLSGDFALSNSKQMHADLRGRYFSNEVTQHHKAKVLEEIDARTLSDSIIHSIVIRPDASSDSSEHGQEYNDAVIQIFRRLNTSGKALQAQELRSCIFYGPFDDFLKRMNENPAWRDLFGTKHSRLKDVEVILRFFALFDNYENYKAPMPSFLNRYMSENRSMESDKLQKLEGLFEQTMERLLAACGSSLFKKGGTLLLSKFDAVTVGFAKAICTDTVFDDEKIRNLIEILMDDPIYKKSTAEFINDTSNVTDRIDIAISIFKG